VGVQQASYKLGHLLELAPSLGPHEGVRRHLLVEEGDLVGIPTAEDPMALLLEQDSLDDYSPVGVGLVRATLGQELLESDGAAGIVGLLGRRGALRINLPRMPAERQDVRYPFPLKTFMVEAAVPAGGGAITGLD